MKMMTKTFPATWTRLEDIDRMVDEKLVSEYWFDAWRHECNVCDRSNRLVATCVTPLFLRGAIALGKPTTFSITLPGKYWK